MQITIHVPDGAALSILRQIVIFLRTRRNHVLVDEHIFNLRIVRTNSGETL